ncbi:L [Glarea lozoyensis ATCC 20868]|uniref:L n=1 Tax=Glarea lozoyensis (strain ATCC 20868 / MF5171) TaxID=1116229 RepID=S3DYD7_GLAL2|nr:L [Glarea lozoyensis ATCC 20868] [Glarea lozoyensis ATCC 20868]EPE36946.1 L [Glarea lozoyensis ATCC 20868] [Glarea lozoyensis ATCC 20868]
MFAFFLTSPSLWSALLSLSLFAGRLYGQAVSSNCGQTLITRTISSQADATAVAACSTFSGSLVIATTLPASDAVINFGALKEIKGSLSAQRVVSLETLNASQLLRIGGDFSMVSLPNLNTLAFRQLLQTEYFTLVDIPFVPRIDFSADTLSGSGLTASTVIIMDTGLTTLASLNLRTVDAVHIRNNSYLSSIALPLQVVRQKVNINHIGALDLRLLRTTENMTLDGLTTFDLRSLENVTDLWVRGSVSELILPSLTNMTNFNIESVRSDFNCSVFDTGHKVGLITGNYSCSGTHQVLAPFVPSPAPRTNITSSPSPSKTNHSSTGSLPTTTASTPTALSEKMKGGSAANTRTIAISVSVSIVGSLATVSALTYLLRKRSKRDISVPEVLPESKARSETSDAFGKPELDNETTYRRELDAGEIRPELSDSDVIQELNGEPGVVEMGNYDPKETYELSAERLEWQEKGNWI